jgi:RimJ/RimL family protein N-acetyltransferase
MLPATVFETNRLRIRHLLESDFDAFHEMQSDAEVMRYTTGSSLDEVENRRQLKMCIECYAKPENDFWVWAITRKVDGQFVGTYAITPNDQRAEIGYRLLRKHFGLGYGKEVCNGVVQFAILQRRLPEIVAYADVRNVASVKILDQSRLRFIAEIRLANGLTDRFYRWLAESASGPNAG